jgi:hypothetical protein
MLGGVMPPGRARVIYCQEEVFKECPYEELPENLEFPGMNQLQTNIHRQINYFF